MNKIQTKQCEQRQQNKEGITLAFFEPSNDPSLDNRPGPDKTYRHYCWEHIQAKLEQKIAESESWERNKKKIFRDCLTKCQKKELFDWPASSGLNVWERARTICKQCNGSLHWDVTAYEDSARHLCSYCSNCNKAIEGKDQPKHFEWNEEALPNYKCEKKELIKPSKYPKLANCLECDWAILQENGRTLNELSDYGSAVSCVYTRNNSKAHSAIITKRHTDDLRQVTRQEWSDMLVVLKDSCNKIDKVYPNLGHDLSMGVGRLGGTSQPHFYMRIVPKYKKDYGNVAYPYDYYIPATLEQREGIKKIFKQGTNDIIVEKSKVLAQVVNDRAPGYTVISTKAHLPNDINAIDKETWDQIGEVMQEIMKKMGDAIDCYDFTIRCYLGEGAAEAWKEESWENSTPAYDDCHRPSEFQWAVYPRFKAARWGGRASQRLIDKKSNKALGSMENERISEKLRDPESYYTKWKNDPNYLENKRKALKNFYEREREQKWL